MVPCKLYTQYACCTLLNFSSSFIHFRVLMPKNKSTWLLFMHENLMVLQGGEVIKHQLGAIINMKISNNKKK